MTRMQRTSMVKWTVPAVVVACAGALLMNDGGPLAAAPAPAVTTAVVDADGRFIHADWKRGRNVVLNHGCADCHGKGPNPASEDYLVGVRDSTQEFVIGPFKTRPRNLTPDNLTGLGRFTERQIFNAIRFGLRPGETPDVDITSRTPGEGNFPAAPKYLAPPMPWPAFRHMPDQDIRDIAAYLKRALRPVRNKVPDSEGPPDFWASEYTPDKIGTFPAPDFPTSREHKP